MRLTKLIEKWRVEAKTTEDEPEFDGGCSYAYEMAARELEIELPAIEQESAAQVAVMLGKAADWAEGLTMTRGGVSMPPTQREIAVAIRTLIPTDAKEALKQREEDVRDRALEEAAQQCQRMLSMRYVITPNADDPRMPDDYKHPAEAIRALKGKPRASVAHDADFREKLCWEMEGLATRFASQVCVDELLAAIAKIREG